MACYMMMKYEPGEDERSGRRDRGIGGVGNVFVH